MLRGFECADCENYSERFGCLCSSYDKSDLCPLNNKKQYGGNKFEDEYARWVLEEMQYEED